MKRFIHILICFIFLQLSYAEAPAGYYVDAEGKSGAELKTALHNIIRNHTYLIYDISTSIWWYDYFKTTDWHPGGYFWDMFSTDKYSTYNGNRQNREHCMPRSWWGTSSNYPSFDANGDLHNLYPSNSTANTEKSNYPLGEVGTITFDNGVVKVGTSSFSGYGGAVFEPADEYKGDFARTYMYMVTCYQDYASNWRSLGISSMLNNNTYPTFKSYGVNLLMKWHRNDPVSTKEINRNDAVFGLQENRNPFIDYPGLAEFIWGDQSSNIWYYDMLYTDLRVFPNPASDFIQVDISKRENQKTYYEIYSLNGVRMDQQQLGDDGRVSLNHIENGMYILVVYNNNTRMTAKFVINKYNE